MKNEHPESIYHANVIVESEYVRDKENHKTTTAKRHSNKQTHNDRQQRKANSGTGEKGEAGSKETTTIPPAQLPRSLCFITGHPKCDRYSIFQ